MNERKLVWTGGIGTVVTAICCFTPVLVILLGILGLSAWLGWIDYVVFPTLAVFLGILGYGLFLYRRRRVSARLRTAPEKSSEHM